MIKKKKIRKKNITRILHQELSQVHNIDIDNDNDNDNRIWILMSFYSRTHTHTEMGVFTLDQIKTGFDFFSL